MTTNDKPMTPEQKRLLLSLVRAIYQDEQHMAVEQVKKEVALGPTPFTAELAEVHLVSNRARARRYLEAVNAKIAGLFRHQQDLIRALNGLDVCLDPEDDEQ